MVRPRSRFLLIGVLTAVPIFTLAVSIAVPLGVKHDLNAHEIAAIQQIRTVQAIQDQFHAQFGHYACSLSELKAAKLLAPGPKSGYVIELRCTTAGYSILAVPETSGRTGRRSFFSDETHVIRQSWNTQPADINSPEI